MVSPSINAENEYDNDVLVGMEVIKRPSPGFEYSPLHEWIERDIYNDTNYVTPNSHLMQGIPDSIKIYTNPIIRNGQVRPK